MNTKQFPTDNLSVRQALLYGTNREAIIDAVFQRFSPVAWGPLSSVTEFYSGDVVGAYAYDPRAGAGAAGRVPAIRTPTTTATSISAARTSK